MEFLKLSVKHFIGDLPNIINTNFEKVKKFAENIFDEKTETIKAVNAKLTGTITANSVEAKNLTVNDKNGLLITMAELVKRVEDLDAANTELVKRVEKLESTDSTTLSSSIDTYAAYAAAANTQKATVTATKTTKKKKNA